MALSNAVPKPSRRWLHKAKQRADEAREMKACFKAVSARDGQCCRVCKRRVGGIGLLEAGHHHHLAYRSRGGEHTTGNVVLLCVRDHSAVHDGELLLSGDGDKRNSEGQLCGVRVERWQGGEWRLEGWR